MTRVKFFKLEYEWLRSQRRLIATAHGRMDTGLSLAIDLSGIEMFFGVCLTEDCTESVDFVRDYIQQHLNIKITHVEQVIAGEYMDVLEDDVGTYYLMYVEDPRRSLNLVSKFSESDVFMRKNVYVYETEFHLTTRIIIESKFEINRWYEIPDENDLIPREMSAKSLFHALLPIKEDEKGEEDDCEIFTRAAIAVRYSNLQKTHFECLAVVGTTENVVFALRPSSIPLTQARMRISDTEQSMVCEFLEYLRDSGLDILIHHRGASEIFPALVTIVNSEKRGDLVRWQIQTAVNKGMTKHNISEPGRIHIDLVRMEQERVKARDMELDDLSMKYLGEHHYAVASSECTAFACLQDAFKIWKIAHEAALITEVIQTSALVHMDPQRFVNTSQEAKTTSLIQHFGKTLYSHPLLKITAGGRQRRLANWGELTNPSHSSSVHSLSQPTTTTYSGGMILDSKPGLYDHWVVQWDFEGHYPSIMIAHNLSTDTLLTKHIIEKRDLVEGFDYVRMETSRNHMVPVAKKSIKEGVLVKVQTVLKKRRMILKDQMKKCDPKGMEWKILDIKQRTVKVLMNSLYGFLGDRTCIFYVESLADMIATWGRKYLGIARDVVSSMPDVEEIVMGNTDSIASKLNSKLTYEQVVQMAWRLASVITSTINTDPVRIQPESIWPKIYIPDKKNAYGGRKITVPPLSDCVKEEESSLECTNIWNRSMCPFICDSLCDLMEALTNESDVSVRVKVENAFGRMVTRLTAKSVPFTDLIFKGKINQELSHYGATREEVDAEGFTKIKMASDIPVTFAMKRKRKEVGDGAMDTSVGAMMSFVAIVEPSDGMKGKDTRGKDVTGYCEASEAWIKGHPIDWNEYRRKLEQAICTQLGDAIAMIWPDISPRHMVHDLLKSSVHIICQREIKSKRLQNAFPCLACRKPVFPQFCDKDKPGFCPSCHPTIEKIIRMDSEMKRQLDECLRECQKCVGETKCIEECANVTCPIYHRRQSANGLRERFSKFYKNCVRCGKLSGVPRESEREVRCCLID